ncbi:MAG: outer membrane beta-barrel protein [Desulfobulbaceae bacterium]|nr:outer membrane beta-barrel protein [Desulfobulbaceae bacterium]
MRRERAVVVCFCSLISLVSFFCASIVKAERNVFSGGVVLRQDYDSNIDRTYQDRRSEWTTAVSPTFKITSRDPVDVLDFSYAPSVVYSHLTEQKRLDHHLAVKFDKALGKRLAATFSDSYVKAEDPSSNEENADGIALSDSRGRNRYWANNCDAGLQYEYGRESFINLSYQHRILDNTGVDQEDFVKNTPAFSVFHRFSPQWQTRLDYAFTDGNFDQTDDLRQNSGDLFLYYSQTPTAKFFGHYGYAETNYDGLQNDYTKQSVSLGWIRQQSSTLDFSLEGGGVFLNRDNQSGKDELFYALSLNQKIERGVVRFSAKGGVDEQQFNGAADEGVSRYWSLNAAASRELRKDIRAAAKCLYREDRYLGQSSEQEKRKFQAEASLSHSFWRWYMISVKYIYTRQSAEIITDRYNDNRLFLEFSFNKDFFSW